MSVIATNEPYGSYRELISGSLESIRLLVCFANNRPLTSSVIIKSSGTRLGSTAEASLIKAEYLVPLPATRISRVEANDQKTRANTRPA